MTITVPLTPEEEAKLIVLAEGRGVSPDTFVEKVVKDIIERGLPPSISEELHSEEREKELEELFHAFDSVNTPPGISEETFHRENWYR